MSAQSACLASRDAISPSKAILVAALVNLIGDYFLTIRLGWGIVGTAWATVFCQVRVRVRIRVKVRV